jgi:hypothetical protein
MEGLTTKGRSLDPKKPGPRSYPIHVFHEEGVVSIPPRLNVPSDEVFHFLLAQFSPGGSREVNPALRDYLQRQEEAFGPERVWSYRARKLAGKGQGGRRPRAVCLAVALAGLAWFASGLALGEPAWIGFGILAAVLGGLFFLAFWATSPSLAHHKKHWRQASLVVSPVGLALVQGDMRGEMRWDELRDVQLHGRPRHFRHGAEHTMPGIKLVVEGAAIVIPDIYDRPLPVIHERIVQYWRGGEAPVSS